jgi:hypothetical protein
MANEGFFSRLGSLPGKRVDDFMEQTRKYQRGEIGVGDQMLQGGANALGLLTDIPFFVAGEAVSAATPDFIKKGLDQVAEGIKDTEAAQVAMQYMQENPQMMKRLGYAMDLSAVPAAKAAKGGMLRDLSLEAPNRQPTFYGSGQLGQVASIARTAPTALYDTLSPKAAASRREGVPMSVRREASRITPERRKKAGDIRNKDKKDRTKEEVEFLGNFNKDLSFLEGQLDQTQLLKTGRGEPAQGVIKSFEKVQALDKGTLSPDILAKAVSLSEPLAKRGISLDKNNLAVIEEKIRKAQGIGPNEKVEVVIRNPTAFSDISKESLRGPNKEATRVFYARSSLQKYFPEKKDFSDQELREAVSMTRLPDDKLYNLSSGKEANRYEQYLYKLLQPKKYGTKGRNDSKTIDMYYKYKKMEQDGVKLRKPQQEIYDGMKARIQQVSETVDVRDGTAYFQGSHLSSAKGLGGANDQYMMNKKGDFVHFIDDENDLFGQTVPGDSRVLSITSPNGYNMFAAAGRAPTSKPSQAKQTFQRELQEMGAEPVSALPKGMLEQAAVGIQKQPMPNVRPSDFKNVGAAGALAAQTARER